MRRLILSLLVLLIALGSSARAQNWADTVFPDASHDFGTVARGSKIKHSFLLINTTNTAIHIAGWTTKCGCTDVKVGAKDIPPGTQTFIEATIDTTKFQGYKASGLTLNFDRPGPAAKDLNLTCFIRSDVTLNPGSVDFGQVSRASGATQTLELSYAGGMSNWGVTRIQTITDAISARLEEVPGSRSGGAVRYRLTTTMKPGVAVGYFKDEITLQTNDTSAPTIPISVSGQVQGAVVLTPAILTLGSLKPGQVVQREILVRGAKPFVIKTGTSKDQLLSIATPSTAPGPLQKITVSIKAPDRPGPYHGQLDLETDLEDSPARLTAFATVVP